MQAQLICVVCAGDLDVIAGSKDHRAERVVAWIVCYTSIGPDANVAAGGFDKCRVERCIRGCCGYGYVAGTERGRPTPSAAGCSSGLERAIREAYAACCRTAVGNEDVAHDMQVGLRRGRSYSHVAADPAHEEVVSVDYEVAR